MFAFLKTFEMLNWQFVAGTCVFIILQELLLAKLLDNIVCN